MPIALTDCLNFGSPEDPEVFWDFDRTVKGIGEAARALNVDSEDEPVPIVSGNVSFYNESSQGTAIAPSPIVACFGVLEDYSTVLTAQLIDRGDELLLVGERSPQLGGSVFSEIAGGFFAAMPKMDLRNLSVMYRAVYELIRMGLVKSCHDIADGGLLVTVAEMMCATAPDCDLGVTLNISGVHDVAGGIVEALFSESAGFIVEVDKQKKDEVAGFLKYRGVACHRIGLVDADSELSVACGEQKILTLRRQEVEDARSRPMREIL
jgi:phosphoribosylformylglycinamidine synthase